MWAQAPPGLLVRNLRFSSLPGNGGGGEVQTGAGEPGQGRESQARAPALQGDGSRHDEMLSWLSSQTPRLSVGEPGPRFAHPQNGVMKALSPGWVELSASSGRTVLSAQPPERRVNGRRFLLPEKLPGEGKTQPHGRSPRWDPSWVRPSLQAGLWVRARRLPSHTQGLSWGACVRRGQALPPECPSPRSEHQDMVDRSSSRPPHPSSGSPLLGRPHSPAPINRSIG